mmetsp:Transcript_27778/g.70144  ORF Transcript_27778/g.70144 Transcript_27778/m.70144 type:complete len:619 (-) Transcript_27778:509-2365(-)|eukprot:g5339.t1
MTVKAVVPDAVPEMPHWGQDAKLSIDRENTTMLPPDGTSQTKIEGVYFVKEAAFDDHRGDYVNVPLPFPCLEGGVAMSRKNVVRGFHCSPFPKLIGCLKGKMFDVLLDLRKDARSFGQVMTTELAPKKGYLYVPAGVAHGYLALEDDTLTQYYKGDFFDPAKEINVNILTSKFPWCKFSDGATAPGDSVPFPVPAADLIISDKDKGLPTFQDLYPTEAAELAGAETVLVKVTKQKKVWYAPHKFESYGDDEMMAVARCLRAGWLAPGPLTALLQHRVSAYFGKKFGLYVNSGSSANLIGIAMCDLPKGSEIVTPACTFSTVLAPIVQLGFKPVFVDVERDSYVPSLAAITGAITEKTSMLMIPNLVGSKIDWKAMRRIVHEELQRPDIVLFEDSCDCMTYTEESDVSAISFYASHIMTGGGMGGMIMMNSEKYFNKAFQYRDWGRIGNNDENVLERFKHSVDGIEYDGKFLYSVVGYNMKSCEMSAAFALSQMSKLEYFTTIRRRNVKLFYDTLQEYGVGRYVLPRADYDSLDWLAFPLQHPERTKLIRYLEDNDVQIRVIFSGNVTRHPAYREYLGDFPVADKIMEQGFLLGAHHGLSEADIKHVCGMLIKFDKGEA